MVVLYWVSDSRLFRMGVNLSINGTTRTVAAIIRMVLRLTAGPCMTKISGSIKTAEPWIWEARKTRIANVLYLRFTTRSNAPKSMVTAINCRIPLNIQEA